MGPSEPHPGATRSTPLGASSSPTTMDEPVGPAEPFLEAKRPTPLEASDSPSVTDDFIASAYINKPKFLPILPPETPKPINTPTPEPDASSKPQETAVRQQRSGPPRLQTVLAKEEARKLECSRVWLLLLDKLGNTSALWTETTQSLTLERLRVRAISAYAASSLEAYLSRCTRFLDFLQAHNIAFATLSLAELADYLDAAFASLAQDRDVCQISPKTTLQALSWLSRVAQVQHLLAIHSSRHSGSTHSPETARTPCPFPWHALWHGSA